MAINYKCPSCGNVITTQYEVNNIKCPYCSNEFLASDSQQPPVFKGGDNPQQGQQQSYQQPGPQPGSQQPYGQQPYGQQQGYQQYGAFQPTSSTDIFATGPSGKSRGVAGLLAIFLGTFGAHYFYLGKNTAGIVFLLVSILGGIVTCGIAAGLVATFVLVQGILMMVMSQDDFEKKYVNTPDQFPLF